MKKRIFALLTAFILCLVMSVTAFAVNTEVQYVSDDSGMYLDADIREKLNGYAEFFSGEVDVDIIFVYTHITDFEECIMSLPLGERQEKSIMIEDEESWDLYTYGEIGKDFGEKDISAVREEYNAPERFSDSVASYIKATAKLVAQKKGKTVSFAQGENSFDSSATKTGPNNTVILDKPDRMVDMADVLSSSEEADLRTKLNELSVKGGIDVSVVTVSDLMGKTLEEYANEIRGFYFDIDILPGAIVKDEDHLIEELLKVDSWKKDEKYDRFNKKFNYLDDGEASRRVSEYLIK